MLGGGVDKRQAHAADGEADKFEGFLHKNGVRGLEQAVHKRQKRFVGSPCLVPLAFGALRDELLHALGRDVAGGRDDAHTAEAHDVVGCGIIAGIHAEALGGGSGDGCNLIHLAGRFLYGDDVLAVVGEAQRGLGFHVDNAAARDVVEDNGELHRICNGLEVLVHSLLRRLVVVRDDAHEAVDTEFRDVLGEVDGVGRAVVPHVGDDGGLAADRLDNGAEKLDLLRVEDRGALAGGSIDDKRVVTAFDKARGKCLRAVEVEFALIVEGRDHSGDQATEAGFNVRHGRLLNSCVRLPAIKARRRTYARFIYYAKVRRADYASCMKFSKPTIRPSRAPTLLIPSKTPGM